MNDEAAHALAGIVLEQRDEATIEAFQGHLIAFRSQGRRAGLWLTFSLVLVAVCAPAALQAKSSSDAVAVLAIAALPAAFALGAYWTLRTLFRKSSKALAQIEGRERGRIVAPLRWRDIDPSR